MKKSILMTISALYITCLAAYSQSDCVDVILDFGEKKFTDKGLHGLKNLQQGDYYRVRINSINMNLYKVSINASDTTDSKALSPPSFADLGIESIGDLLAAIGSFSSISPAVGAPPFNTMFYSPASESIKSITTSINGSSTEPIGQQLIKTAESLASFQKEIDKSKSDIEDYKINLDKHYLNSLKETPNTTPVLNLDDELKKVQVLRNTIKEIGNRLETENEKYTTYTKSKRKDIDSKPDLKKADALIVESFASLNKSVNILLESISSENVLTYLKRLVLINNNSGTYVSLPIQFNGEKGKVIINISPVSTELALPSYSTELHFPTKANWYISSGLAFYYAGLKSEVYSTQSFVVDTLTNYRLIKEDEQSGEIGLTALLRIGRISTKDQNLGYHVNFGPAFSISEKAKPRFLLGAGLTYGVKHCISVDAGWAIGHVQQLSNAFSLDDTYRQAPGSATVETLSGSYFVAVGYAFRL